MGQPFVVEDRPGAGGILGTQQIISAAPDGYTIGITNLSTLSLIPVINSEATYKPLADLKHIAFIGGSPVVLAANAATRIKTLDEVAAYANAPGHAFTFSSSGVGSDGHLMGVAIATALKLKPEHVPYKSTATDVVAGHVPFSTSTLSSTSGFLHGMRCSALPSLRRNGSLISLICRLSRSSATRSFWTTPGSRFPDPLRCRTMWQRS